MVECALSFYLSRKMEEPLKYENVYHMENQITRAGNKKL